MPLVIVEVVAATPDTRPPGLAQSVADAIGHALTKPPGRVWVRVRWVPRDEYAENGAPPGADEGPVFVTIVERCPPTGAKLEAEVAALTTVVAQAVGRPAACVHLEYAPAAAGRVAFGGKLVQ